MERSHCNRDEYLRTFEETRDWRRRFGVEKRQHLRNLLWHSSGKADLYGGTILGDKILSKDGLFIYECFLVALEVGRFQDFHASVMAMSHAPNNIMKVVLEEAILADDHNVIGDLLDLPLGKEDVIDKINDRLLLLACRRNNYNTVEEFVFRGYRLRLSHMQWRIAKKSDLSSSKLDCCGEAGRGEDDMLFLQVLTMMARPAYILACYLAAAEENGFECQCDQGFLAKNVAANEGSHPHECVTHVDFLPDPNCQFHPECNDPIYRAFDLARLASSSIHYMPQYRTELSAVADECRQLAADLLRECSTPDEVQTLMQEEAASRKYFPQGTSYPRLKLALEDHHKEFVGQVNCQYFLSKEFYGSTDWQRLGVLSRILYAVIQVILTPAEALFAFVIYAGRDLAKLIGVPEEEKDLHPESKWDKWFDRYLKHCQKATFNLEVPFHKFISTLGWFLMFLSVVTVAVMKPLTPDSNSGQFHWYNGLILGYSLIAIYNGVLEYNPHSSVWHFLNFWRLYTFIMYTLYVVSLVLRLVMTFNDSCDQNMEDYVFICPDDYVPTRTMLNDMATLCFSFAAILSVIRLMYYLQLHAELGPIVIVCSKVILDIFTMVVIYTIILVAFSFGFIFSWSSDIYMAAPNDPSHDNNQSSYDAIPGTTPLAHSVDPTSTTPQPAETEVAMEMDANFIDSYFHLISLLFWSILEPGQSEPLDPYHGTNIKQYTLSITYAIFQVLAVIVMLNLLIAIMNNTVTRVEGRRETYWKFSRAQMWMAFMGGGLNMRLPSPFSILDAFWWAFLWPASKIYLWRREKKLKRLSARFGTPMESAETRSRRIKHAKLMVNLVNRYLRKGADHVY